MLRLSRRGMVSVAGGLWGGVGLVLCCVGSTLLWRSSGMTVCLLGTVAIAAGALKGALLLRGVVDRNVARIRGLPSAARVWSVYRLRGWVFFAGMMCLGILLRRLSAAVPGSWGSDVLGAIDLTVGIALLVGAARYHKALAQVSEVEVRVPAD